MLKDLIPLAEQIQALHREAYWQYLPKVEALIKSNIQDDNTIQALLDHTPSRRTGAARNRPLLRAG
jgi:hypothetical protein